MAEQQLGFTERNNIIKIEKATGSFGWMRLIVAEDKLSHKKFIRLKKYMNWFSVKSPDELQVVQSLLFRGASELSWVINSDIEINIAENDVDEEDSIQISNDDSIPDAVMDYFEQHPEVIEQFLALKVEHLDYNYIFSLFETIGKTIIRGNDRIKFAFKEVREKIANEDAKGMQELSDLMDKYNLLQIASVTNLVKQRIEIMNTIEKLIHDENTYEIRTDQSIHRVLEKNMWIVDEQYWIAQSNKSLRTFIGDEMEKKHKQFTSKRPDFACVDFENRLIILELKRPSVELKKEELDQAELYLRLIKQYRSINYKNIQVILLGNKISDEAREIVELRWGVEIKTYQEFLSKARKRYQNFLRAIEENQLPLGFNTPSV
jgi:RecB family endonuclease NucS